MGLYIFSLIFLASLAGLAFLFRRHFLEIRKLPLEEVGRRLASSGSVRRELHLRYLAPWRGRFNEVYLPNFWRRSEKLVRRARLVVMKFEKRLSDLSDKLRGKHVNLDIQERGEYWETLNGAKENNKKKEEE
ncbi:MAG: hypothetical protein Q8Q97_00190 [bacterium]|nr:hypothetical protein [bacterium]